MVKNLAKKTTTARAQAHENYIAKMYGGRRSPSSGASWSDRGDVRVTIKDDFDYTAECKTTEKLSFSIKLETWNKIVEEAQEQNRRPCMFIRFEHETGKTTDLVVRSIHDDLEMNEC
jgi:Holliday junction resolvase